MGDRFRAKAILSQHGGERRRVRGRWAIDNAGTPVLALEDVFNDPHSLLISGRDDQFSIKLRKRITKPRCLLHKFPIEVVAKQTVIDFREESPLQALGDSNSHDGRANELIDVVAVAAPWRSGHAAEHRRTQDPQHVNKSLSADVMGFIYEHQSKLRERIESGTRVLNRGERDAVPKSGKLPFRKPVRRNPFR